jgi:hypothetical protein
VASAAITSDVSTIRSSDEVIGSLSSCSAEALQSASDSPQRRRHFAAAASRILSSRSQPFSSRAATAASHICVTAAMPYFFGKLQFSHTEAMKYNFYNAITIV